MKYRALLFDLDGTLLKTDKTISKHTLNSIEECKKTDGLYESVKQKQGGYYANKMVAFVRYTFQLQKL